MGSPSFVADFDSSTALVRALAASLAGRRFRRLGHGFVPGALTRASSLLPERARTRAFSIAGATEAISPSSLRRVSPDSFAEWVTARYPRATAPAVAIGSSDGAVMHLCAAAGVPWLPQTFLALVRRGADPDDVRADVDLGRRVVPAVLRAHPSLQAHQMHDANEDRLMVRHVAYLRMKMLSLPVAYQRFIQRVLPPGGQLVIVDDELRWPARQLGERHYFQAGAVGGLDPAEYLHGGPRVAELLARQGVSTRRWRFPECDVEAPEAEWGFAPELASDVESFAALNDYRVVRLRLEKPCAASGYVADVYQAWFDRLGITRRRLLVETFICVEPGWALRAAAAPFWTPFAVRDSLDAATEFAAQREMWDQIAVTLFAHGVRSAGIALPAAWMELAAHAKEEPCLAGVRVDQWPADFASLARYSDALDGFAPANRPVERLPWADVRELGVATPRGMSWEGLG